MTKDEIKRLAIEAGFQHKTLANGEYDLPDKIYRFANDLLTQVAAETVNKINDQFLMEDAVRAYGEDLVQITKKAANKGMSLVACIGMLEDYKLRLFHANHMMEKENDRNG